MSAGKGRQSLMFVLPRPVQSTSQRTNTPESSYLLLRHVQNVKPGEGSHRQHARVQLASQEELDLRARQIVTRFTKSPPPPLPFKLENRKPPAHFTSQEAGKFHPSSNPTANLLEIRQLCNTQVARVTRPEDSRNEDDQDKESDDEMVVWVF